MEGDVKTPGAKNSGAVRKKRKWGGVLSQEGRARFARYACILLGVLLVAVAYALATGRDIPAAAASIVSVLLHAVMGM